MKIGQTQPTAKDRDDRPGFTGVHPATGSGDDHASNDSESDHGLVKVPAPGDGGPHANEIRNAKAAAKANKLRDTTAEVVARVAEANYQRLVMHEKRQGDAAAALPHPYCFLKWVENYMK